MKRFLSLFAALLIMGSFAARAEALTFSVGEVNFVLTGDSYFYLQQNDQGLLTELRGLFSVQSIEQGTGNTIYSFGENDEYFHIRFGALNPIAFADSTVAGSVGYYDSGYAELYMNNSHVPYQTDIAVGPGTDPNSDFGVNIDDGTLLLGMSFVDNVFAANPDATFRSVVTQEAANAFDLTNLVFSTLGYLNVNSGAWLDTFDTNGFVNFNDADIKLQGEAEYVTTNTNGWNVFKSTSYSAQANAVPEPSTMLLLGVGILGLAATARKRARN